MTGDNVHNLLLCHDAALKLKKSLGKIFLLCFLLSFRWSVSDYSRKNKQQSALLKGREHFIDRKIIFRHFNASIFQIVGLIWKFKILSWFWVLNFHLHSNKGGSKREREREKEESLNHDYLFTRYTHHFAFHPTWKKQHRIFVSRLMNKKKKTRAR